jgi:hypothetical protein
VQNIAILIESHATSKFLLEVQQKTSSSAIRVICRGLWIFAIGMLACAMAMVGVILGSVGIVRRMHDRANEQMSNLWETKCVVTQRAFVPYVCQECDALNCNTTICHEEKYQVAYPIFDETKLISWINVNDTINQHDVEVSADPFLRDQKWTFMFRLDTNTRATTIAL